MANCKECKENRVEVKTPENVPYIVHEAAMARNERNVKRLVVALVFSVLVGIVGVLSVHFGWLYYESQFETFEYSYDYQQDGQGTNIIGDGNDVNNGAETESQD